MSQRDMNRFTLQTLPIVIGKHFFMNIFYFHSFGPQKKKRATQLCFSSVHPSNTVAILTTDTGHWTWPCASVTRTVMITPVIAVLHPYVTYLLTGPRASIWDIRGRLHREWGCVLTCGTQSRTRKFGSIIQKLCDLSLVAKSFQTYALAQIKRKLCCVYYLCVMCCFRDEGRQMLKSALYITTLWHIPSRGRTARPILLFISEVSALYNAAHINQ
jgi:hypothetical protein